MRLQIHRGYYYLTPLWFLLEACLFRGFRAGPLVGHSLLGVTAFYAVEGAIAVAYWKNLPGAGGAAFAENAITLIAALRFIYMQPVVDYGMVDVDPGKVESALFASQEHLRQLPNIVISLYHVGVYVATALAQDKGSLRGAVQSGGKPDDGGHL